jgi:hypothetical protein
MGFALLVVPPSYPPLFQPLPPDACRVGIPVMNYQPAKSGRKRRVELIKVNKESRSKAYGIRRLTPLIAGTFRVNPCTPTKH